MFQWYPLEVNSLFRLNISKNENSIDQEADAGYFSRTTFGILTSLDISDVVTVWTWEDKRPPAKKTEKTGDFEKKISIRNMAEIA